MIKEIGNFGEIIFLFDGYLRHDRVSKAVPLRHAGAKEDLRYSSYSLTSSLDGGEWSPSLPGCALPPEKGPPVPIIQEGGWASALVWTQRLQGKSFASAGD
jgi:hypothetical protein